MVKPVGTHAMRGKVGQVDVSDEARIMTVLNLVAEHGLSTILSDLAFHVDAQALGASEDPSVGDEAALLALADKIEALAVEAYGVRGAS